MGEDFRQREQHLQKPGGVSSVAKGQPGASVTVCWVQGQ